MTLRRSGHAHVFAIAEKSRNVYSKISRTANDFFRKKGFLEKPGSQAVESNNPEQQMIAWEPLWGIPSRLSHQSTSVALNLLPQPSSTQHHGRNWQFCEHFFLYRQGWFGPHRGSPSTYN